MADYDAMFWKEASPEKQQMVETFESNITVEHPDGANCWCSHHCPWAATTVNYPTYNGPKVSHL